MSRIKSIPEIDVGPGLVDTLAAISRQLRIIELPRGITAERLSVLALIDEHGPISTSDLAVIVGVKVPTISRMTSFLEEDGYIGKAATKSDGRGVSISLTPKGRRVLKSASKKSADQLRVALSRFSTRQIAALVSLTDALQSMQVDKDAGQ
jgi:DNA-binding MarR family transcriptional regulator